MFIRNILKSTKLFSRPNYSIFGKLTRGYLPQAQARVQNNNAEEFYVTNSFKNNSDSTKSKTSAMEKNKFGSFPSEEHAVNFYDEWNKFSDEDKMNNAINQSEPICAETEAWKARALIKLGHFEDALDAFNSAIYMDSSFESKLKDEIDDVKNLISQQRSLRCPSSNLM